MEGKLSYVGRLAPSPTGALHWGNVRTFMIAWLRARSQGGRVIMRMEDLDHPKDKPGAAAQAVEDLRWLGFDWDEEYVQSERKALYREALEILRNLPIPQSPNRTIEQSNNRTIEQSNNRTIEQSPNLPIPLVYPCVCSRKDVESAQSAPHAGEQLHYPGTCRGRFSSWREAYAAKGAAPCWRFAVPAGTVVEFEDAFAGKFRQDVGETLGDFPLARDEFGAGYTLAAVVDDLLMGVTEVVRGDDLLAATPAQILVARALQAACASQSPTHSTSQPLNVSTLSTLSTSRLPAYCHVPLVVGPDGRRLAKRHGDTRVSTFRQEGGRPEKLLGRLAASCGWCGLGELVTLRELLGRFNLSTIPHTPFMI